MITFRQYLAEIFDTKDIIAWKTVAQESHYSLHDFSFKDSKFSVAIRNRNMGGASNDYNIAFDRDGRLDLAKKYNLQDTLKIYNTVIDIIKTKVKPYLKSRDGISFEAFDMRTMPIYNKFSKIVAKEIDGKVVSTGYIVKL